MEKSGNKKNSKSANRHIISLCRRSVSGSILSVICSNCSLLRRRQWLNKGSFRWRWNRGLIGGSDRGMGCRGQMTLLSAISIALVLTLTILSYKGQKSETLEIERRNQRQKLKEWSDNLKTNLALPRAAFETKEADENINLICTRNPVSFCSPNYVPASPGYQVHAIKYPDGNIQLLNVSLDSGLDSSLSGACEGFQTTTQGSGTTTCPFRIDIQWVPDCLGDPDCKDPIVKLTVKFLMNFPDRLNLNMENYDFTIDI